MGVQGYGIDQCYLWFRQDGDSMDANMLAFIEDDFDRMRSTVFLRNPKPLLQLSGSDIAVANLPVPRWGDPSRDGWLGRFPSRTATFQMLSAVYARQTAKRRDMFPIAARVFEQIHEMCNRKNQKFVLAYLPSEFRGADDLKPSRQGAAVLWVHRQAEKMGVPFVNLTSAFQRTAPQDRKDLFEARGGHYSKLGNRLVATTLLRELQALFRDMPRCLVR